MRSRTLSRALNDILEESFEEAKKFKDEYVSTEHLFLAIAGADRDPAGRLLKKSGASHEAILQALAGVRGSQRVTSRKSSNRPMPRSRNMRAISRNWQGDRNSIR